MQNLFKKIKRKVNGAIISLIFTGVILVLLAILIVWTNFVLQLVIGLLAIIMAYAFFHLAYRLWWIKKEVEKYFKL
jgi:ABC-type bacteriocin/lantibiotic exporter with double-glycine peptidase domain